MTHSSAKARRAAGAADSASGISWLPGSGEMARLIRTTDWSVTPIGVASSWSPALRATVRLMLANRFPQVLWWGPEFIQLYNDTYVPIIGTKHPPALGQRGRDCWTEIWEVIEPLIVAPFSGGPATWMDDIPLELHRHGFLEETHFTIAYSAVPDDSAPSGIGGVLGTIHETTRQVVQERRLTALSDLASHAAEARSVEEACEIIGAGLERCAQDVPFALVYLTEPDGATCRLAGTAGVPPESGAAETLSLASDDDNQWPAAAAFRTGAVQRVTDLERRMKVVPPGPWPAPPRAALLLPIASSGQNRPAGQLVLGVSARLAVDDAYASFAGLVAAHTASAITNARAYERERERAESLAELDRAKTAFFANVSHEFRTPLTLMLGSLDDALSRSDGLSADLQHEIKLAHRNSLRVLKLVNTLLDFSRIESGRIDAHFQPTDLAAYTADLASNFRSLTEKAGLVLLLDCEPLPEPVYVDRDMWEKIVLNLVSNAYKHTFEGAIAVTVRPAGMHAELEVRDSGTGIPADAIPHLFERFHRVPRTRSRTHEGTGIGLALVQELVRLHMGEVEVESKEGTGSRFTVRIPLGTRHLPPKQLSEPAAVNSTAIGAAPFVEEAARWTPETDAGAAPEAVSSYTVPVQLAAPGARVLIADDNADMRAYLVRLLGAHWGVEAVPDGQAALDAIEQRPPDLVLADVMMPRLDGLELVQRLRAEPATAPLPVLLLSARAGEEARIAGLEAGAHGYLFKPFAARELVARVGAALSLARLRADTDRELAASEARLRQSAKMESIGRLAGGLAHDFNNQLHILRGFAGYAADDPGISSESHDDLLEVQRAADRMADLTRQLLAFSRQQVLKPEVLDLDQAIAESQALLQRLIGSQIDYQVTAGPDAKWIRVDRAQLQQVLMNLSINARDAMPEGGRIEIHTHVRRVSPAGQTTLPPGDYAELTLTDTGAGISADDLPHIFEPFFTTKGAGQGTGLGLATAYGVVLQSGGHIRVESTPGQGACFTLLFPLEPVPAVQDEPPPVTTDASSPRELVLVVEDEPAVRALIARAVRQAGFDVVEASDGLEALEQLRTPELNVALVLSDVIMPNMGGKELGRHLAAQFPSLPVIWMSGYSRETADSELDAFTQPFLQKPVSPEALSRAIRETMRQRQHARIQE